MMANHVSEEQKRSYFEDGFVVFPGIIPEDLLAELRIEAEKGRAAVTVKNGRPSQRLQPLVDYPEHINMRPFDRYQALEPLRLALTELLEEPFGEEIMPWATRPTVGILYEPADQPWCTNWHRDYRDVTRGLDLDAWFTATQDIRMFNQVNCPLYDDESLWVIPGSHAREDTDEEIRRFPDRPISTPSFEGSIEECEEKIREYAQSMPGAIQVSLKAGDYLMYRNSLWHIGVYSPRIKRATIHDGIFSRPQLMFYAKTPIRRGEDGKPLDMDNPNTDRPAYREIMETREGQNEPRG